MRPTFVKVVNENLSDVAASIPLPVCLIYGGRDTETPVAIGEIFASRIKGAKLHVLPRYGHLDILSDGRFQVQALIKEFINRLCS
jgi:pimeloyl-ACP methyl ester carboxylesterase